MSVSKYPTFSSNAKIFKNYLSTYFFKITNKNIYFLPMVSFLNIHTQLIETIHPVYLQLHIDIDNFT